MIHLSSFEAVHYRGLNGLSIPRLSAANLVTGANGVGKTALLEAMWLFMGRHSPMLLWNKNIQRSGNPVVDPVSRLSHGVLELHGVENGTEHRLASTFEHVPAADTPAVDGYATHPIVGRLDTHIDGSVVDRDGGVDGLHQAYGGTVRYVNPKAPAQRPNCFIEGTKYHLDASGSYLQYYSEIVRDAGKDELRSALNVILPNVSDIEILMDEAQTSYLSAVTADGRQLPLDDLGGGVVRLFRLMLSCYMSRNGILFADEIENGIHHSTLTEIWRRIRRWMTEWNVQVVATTHSNECIAAAMTAFEDAPHDLSIHKLFLNRETAGVEAATFNGKTIEGARDLNLEVR